MATAFSVECQLGTHDHDSNPLPMAVAGEENERGTDAPDPSN